MFAKVTELRYWKSELSNLSTCEDASEANIARGLLAVADGAGTTSFSDIWARILVELFVNIPLMSDDPFEVEWWVRLAQNEYAKRVPRPEDLPWPAQQKARDGSQSTLVTLRIPEAVPEEGPSSVHVQLLAFGDSCIFIGTPKTHQVKSFPLEKLSDFDPAPICVPSLARVFNRNYHRCKAASVELNSGDIVIIATDAVAKWIISNGAGRYHDKWQSFRTIAEQVEDPEAWPTFIKHCRAKGEMVDDDSTALVFTLSSDPGYDQKLGATATHSDQVIQTRKKEFEEALAAGNTDVAAIYYGDGIDLKTKVTISQEYIHHARKVADALREVIQVVRNNINDPQFPAKVSPIWDKYSDLLLEESCAKNIRETLGQKGVPIIQKKVSSRKISSPPEPNPASNLQSASIDTPISRQEQVVAPVDSSVRKASIPSGFPAESNNTPDPVNSSVHSPILQEDASQKTVVMVPHPSTVSEPETEGSTQQTLAQLERVFSNTSDKNALQLLVQIRNKLQLSELVFHFAKAYCTEDDDSILATYQELQKHNHMLISFIPKYRIDLARLRNAAKVKFQVALESRNAQNIVKDYDEILDSSNNIGPEERKQLELARNLVAAYSDDDDDAILTTRRNIEIYKFSNFLIFTPEEEQRYKLARERKEALQRLRDALNSRRFTRIVQANNPILKHHPQITKEEWEKIKLAKSFFDSYKSHKGEEYVYARDEVQLSPYHEFFYFNSEEDKYYEEEQRQLMENPGSATRIAIVNGEPITHELFRKVYSLRKSYIRYRINLLKDVKKGSSQTSEQQAILSDINRLEAETRSEPKLFRAKMLEDLVNDLLIQAGIHELASDKTDAIALNSDVDNQLSTELAGFKAYYKNNYQVFLDNNKLIDEDIEDALRVFLRRNFADEHFKHKSELLDEWLARRKIKVKRYPQRILVVNPPPELPEPEQKPWHKKLFGQP